MAEDPIAAMFATQMAKLAAAKMRTQGEALDMAQSACRAAEGVVSRDDNVQALIITGVPYGTEDGAHCDGLATTLSANLSAAMMQSVLSFHIPQMMQNMEMNPFRRLWLALRIAFAKPTRYGQPAPDRPKPEPRSAKWDKRAQKPE